MPTKPTEKKLSEKTAREIAEEKAQALTKELGVFKVHPIVFKVPGTEEEVIGYIKEPSRDIKFAVMDRAVIGPYSAAREVFDAHLLKDHSDPRIFSEQPAHDPFYMGAVMALYRLIEFSVNQAKKN